MEILLPTESSSHTILHYRTKKYVEPTPSIFRLYINYFFYINIIFQFAYSLTLPNQEHINKLLKSVEVNISISRKSTLDSIASEELVIPELLPLHILVILRPSKAAEVNEKFWLGNLCFYI